MEKESNTYGLSNKEIIKHNQKANKEKNRLLLKHSSRKQINVDDELLTNPSRSKSNESNSNFVFNTQQTPN